MNDSNGTSDKTSFKILYLHGFATNKTLMRFQSRQIVKRLPWCKHVFINAPIVSDVEPNEMVKRMVDPPYYYYCKRKDGNYQGLEYSLQFLKKYVKDNDIDAIVAFSQATYVTSMILDSLDLKFFVSVCGLEIESYMDINNNLSKKINISEMIKTKSFHIIGKEDPFYDRGIKLAKRFCNHKLLEHSGGHCFPSERYIYDKLIEWICN